MAERDRFEFDLTTALRAYLDEAPTEVRPTELARQFAAAYPHRRAALGRWGFGLTPAPARLLLLAGLLVAVVGGTLIAGSQFRRFQPAVVPPVGQLYECPPWSTPDEPGPVDQAAPPEAAIGVAFDRRAGRLAREPGAHQRGVPIRSPRPSRRPMARPSHPQRARPAPREASCGVVDRRERGSRGHGSTAV